MGLRLVAADAAETSETCSCDGFYIPEPYAPSPTILYAPTPRSRRESFTLVHELGHHLIRLDDGLLSAIADADEGRDRIEERICDAFAGRVLIPDDSVRVILNGEHPRAAHVTQLFNSCNGSLEACVVRLAEHLPCDGYIALLDRSTYTLRFASASPECGYSWGRGSKIPMNHSAWSAARSGSFNGEGEVVWASGQRKNMWLDAVGNGPLVTAVFSANRYWGGAGLSILSDASITKAMPTFMGGTCAHCGANVFGLRACDKCGDVKCRRCGRCGCGAPTPLMKTCSTCHMTKGKSQFHAGSLICRDCDPA